jgi:phosphoglycolate phosphatase
MLNFSYFIFDLDGTLVDSLPGIAWSIDCAFTDCSLPRPSCDLGKYLGPPIRNILAAISGISDPDKLNRLEYAFRRSYDSEGWRKTRCFKGVPDLLEQLQMNGAELYLVTNKPPHVTARILGELNLADFFEEVACRGSHGSKADVLAALLERRHLAPDDGLMVGDTQEDSAAAAAAGMPCRIVNPNHSEVLTI